MICAERINFRNTWLLYCSSWSRPSAELLVLHLQSHILSTSLNKSQFFYSFDNEIRKRVPNNPYLGVSSCQTCQISNGTHTSTTSPKEPVPPLVSLHDLRRNLRNYPQDGTAHLFLVRSTLECGTPRFHSHADINQIQCLTACFVWITITLGNQAASPICSIN